MPATSGMAANIEETAGCPFVSCTAHDGAPRSKEWERPVPSFHYKNHTLVLLQLNTLQLFPPRISPFSLGFCLVRLGEGKTQQKPSTKLLDRSSHPLSNPNSYLKQQFAFQRCGETHSWLLPFHSADSWAFQSHRLRENQKLKLPPKLISTPGKCFTC